MPLTTTTKSSVLVPPNGAAPPLTGLARNVVEDFVDLVGSQLALARAELMADALAGARRAGLAMAAGAAVAFGYSLLVIALAFGVRRWMGLSGAFATVGALHLAAGALAVFHLRRAGGMLLPKSAREVEASLSAITAETRHD